MRERIRLTQLDGKLPNMALMKLAHWHRGRGDEVTFTRRAERDLFEPDYDVVYGSAIFQFSAPKLARFLDAWPQATVGGTGTDRLVTVEEILGVERYEHYDYSPYPDYASSIGFTQRGCRLRCKFCVVPTKEGKNYSLNTIADIWRGEGHPKHLHLLDNDFFGQPETEWRSRIAEIRDGHFKVCINQGINIRLLTPEAAEALATIEYRDDGFARRRLYTAWDNLKDGEIFFRGVDLLERAGIPPTHLMAYMLVGFAPDETWARIFERFERMVDRGIRPYPMVYDCRAKEPERFHRLKQFQRWVLTGLYRAIPFSDYDSGTRAGGASKREDQAALFTEAVA